MGSRQILLKAGAATVLGLGALSGCGERQSAPAPEAAPTPIIARADLFGEPARHNGRLSPRGDRVAFVAPRDGAANLWVLSVDAMDEARPLTDLADRGIGDFVWGADSATLFYSVDETGAGTTRLYAVSADGGEPRALSPAGARAEIIGVSADDPDHVIITLNQRDANWPDVYSVSIADGSRDLVFRNGGANRFVSFLADRANVLRLGVRVMPDGGGEIAVRDDDGSWRTLLNIPFEDAMSSAPLAFEAGGASFLMLDSTGRDRAALVRVDLATGVKTVLGESARADVADVWLDPVTQAPEAFASEYLRREWRAIDAEAQADLEFLDAQLTGDFRVASRSADDGRWIVVEEGPAIPARSYLYDRSNRADRRMTLLFRHRPALEQAQLQPMTPIEIEARDGLTLVSYLTLPPGSDADGDARPEIPRPLVVAPHDGPWARDSYGFNPLHQWLANRGYAVLSVNFRGSTGFGKAFLNAANRAWGAGVQQDLQDAVGWALQSGVAEAERIAIVGEGFGGYSALAGLAFTPDQFRCGAALNAPANLAALVESSPSLRDVYYARVGDPRTAEGRQALRAQSPLTQAGQVSGALLLALGERDTRASRAEYDQIAAATRAVAPALTYIAFPNEGRRLSRAGNRLAYYAVLERFLGDCLGGRVEPVGAAFEGAEMRAIEGAANVPGLTAFAVRRAPAPAIRSLSAPVEEELVEEEAPAVFAPPPVRDSFGDVDGESP